MTADSNPHPPAANPPEPEASSNTLKSALFKLPGLVAISLYMLLLAVVVVVLVTHGRVGPLYLVFPPLFIAGGLGLLFLLRWAWALSLAAVALLAGVFFWASVSQHLFYALVQGLLNLVFFLYLVRPEVRTKLRY
jgi:hypothetical protein